MSFSRILTGSLLILSLAACSYIAGEDKNMEGTQKPASATGAGWRSPDEAGAAQAGSPPMPRFEAVPGGSYGALGLNTREYLSDRTLSPEQRLGRLENAVIGLQEDLKSMAPALQSLVYMEPALQKVAGPLSPLPTAPVMPASKPPQKLAAKSPAATAPVQAPVPAPAPQPVLQPAPQTEPLAQAPASASVPAAPAAQPQAVMDTPMAAKATIKDLRLGDHSNTVRIVLDSTAPVTYRYDLDNTEHLLVVELAGAAWAGKTEWVPAKSDLVTSYSVQPLAGRPGSRLIVQLRKDTKVVKEDRLAPDATGTHRLYFDLAK
jgi:hypothetical protein